MSEKWKIGDRIGGFYEIREILGGEGKSGMGVVYVCFYRWHQKIYALKTYQERFAILEEVIDTFHKEATLWMGLERHPNIVQANWVHNLDGQIYVVMEYIPADSMGRLTLNHHLIDGRALPFLRTLIWAIQLCYGMEYAYSNGVRVHRDIKPDNILITLDKTLKITDFGLARAFDIEDPLSNGAAGTPFWMSPEQFEDAKSCNVRSDIYSFGVVLYQMTSGRLPFQVLPSLGPTFFDEMYKRHRYSEVPRLDNDLFPIIEKCLTKNPEDRWKDFEELRHEIEILWENVTTIPIPKPLECKPLSVKEINQKGVALKHLKKPAEAVFYHDKALEIDPIFANAWNDKGVAFEVLDRKKEALDCYNRAIEIDYEFIHPRTNRARLLFELGRFKESITCYDEALEIDPEFIDLWEGKGDVLLSIKKYETAIYCYDKALEINQRDSWAWYRKGVALYFLNKYHDALQCAENALKINRLLSSAQKLIQACHFKIGGTEM